MHDELYQAMTQSIIQGEIEQAKQLALHSVEQGLDPLKAINQGFVPGISQVGDQYGCGELYLPDLMLAGEAMKSAMSILEPELARLGAERPALGKVVIGTVHGDMHDIGKTLVGTILAAAGFKIFDLGIDVPIDAFIRTVREEKADMVGLSALLTTTMPVQKQVIDALEEAGLRQQVRVIVGGAPVTQQWADEIGADGFSEDALGAIPVAKKLLNRE
ncbi:MAG: corrinoid protein [Anaerolineales bacterium]|nr:corrinoid protein [Anaerolineales bacterium]